MEHHLLAAEATEDRRDSNFEFVIFHVKLTELILIRQRYNIGRVFDVLVFRLGVSGEESPGCASCNPCYFALRHCAFSSGSEQLFSHRFIVHSPRYMNYSFNHGNH